MASLHAAPPSSLTLLPLAPFGVSELDLGNLGIFASFSSDAASSVWSDASVLNLGGGGVDLARMQVPFPKGPNLEKFQDLEIFQSKLKFSSEPPTKPLFLWGILEVDLEIFKRA